MFYPIFRSRFSVLELSGDRLRIARFERNLREVRRLSDQVQTIARRDGSGIDAWVAALDSQPPPRRDVRAAVLVIPHELVAWRLLKLPRAERRQREKLLRFEATHNLPWPADRVQWMQAPGQAGLDDSPLVVAGDRAVLERLVAAVAARGYDLVAVIPAGLAIREGSTASREHGGTLIVDLRESTMAILLAGAEDRWAIRTVRTRTVTDGSTAWDATQLNLIAAEVIRSQLHFEAERTLPAPKALQVLRSPDDASAWLHGLRTRLRAELRMPPGPDAGDLAGHEDWAIHGAARLVARGGGVPWLLPDAIRAARAKRFRRRHQVAAVACAAASLIAVAIELNRTAQALGAKAAAMEKSLAPFLVREAHIRSQRQQVEQLERDGAFARDFDRRRAGWLRLLAGFESAIRGAEPAWVDSMKPAPEPTGGELRIGLGGWVAEEAAAEENGAAETYRRARDLFQTLAQCPGVVRVERERLDWKGGLLRFECDVLVPVAIL